MRVTLCYPSLLPGQKPKYGLQPLGILHIASLLRTSGIDVTTIDADIEGLTVDEMRARILESAPDLVGLSLMTPQLIPSLQLTVALREVRPTLPIVLGGAHIDSTHGDVFTMSDTFDAAVHGEGECALLDIVRRIVQNPDAPLREAFVGVPNAIYRDANGTIVVNPTRPFLPTLDDLPPVDYDMLDVHRYSIPTMDGRYVLSMMLSRGCPFKCTFCDAPITMGKKLRFWSLDRIIRDIRFNVEKYGCTNFVFKDSTFTANKKWAHEFCDAVIASGLKIKWRCNTRVNLVPQPLLQKMREAGCYVINFGVESGNPTILKNIEKETRIEDVYDAHRRCRELGIRTYATFLMGNPGETDETARETIEVAKGIKPNLAMFFVNTAYPGTPLYDQAVAQGLVEPEWWKKQAWDQRKNSAFQVRWGWTTAGGLKIPGFDAELWQRRATREFYLRPFFVWDTCLFVLRNPYFLRHLLNLGKELVPIYRLRSLFGRPKTPAERELITARCPSAPNWERIAPKPVAAAPEGSAVQFSRPPRTMTLTPVNSEERSIAAR
jgi:radical SAM superfamily enzyme YgiQ (UPF0313 family)